MAPGSRVWLGGDTHSRSVLRVSRMDRVEWVVLAVFVAGAFAVLWTGRSLVALFGALVVAGAGALVVLPVDAGLGQDWVSVSYWARTRLAWWVRRRAGLTRNGAGGAPGWAGSIALGDVESPVGVVGVAQHARQGSYYSVVLEAQGAGGSGVGAGEAWSAFLAHASSQACPVSHVVQTSRVMAWDPTDHVSWVSQMVDRAGAGGALVDSYAQIVDDLAEVGSAQRTWVTLRFPVAALGGGGDPFTEVARVVAGLVERASDLGVAMRPLDCRGRGALVRHLLDPGFAPDDLRGVDGSWTGVFGRWEARGDGRATVVGGAWEASVWEVPASQIAPGWLSRDWLYPLLRGVDGALVRTVVVAADLQSRSRAARRAIEDVTSDLAALGRQPGKVLGGDEDAQAGGSAVRLRDLGPDSGAGGVRWSMAVSWHSAPGGMWERDERAVRGALEDCSVRAPHRLRYRQDQALAWIAALGAAWKEGRK